MRAYERLLNYVSIHTTSNENADTVPSTEGQFVLARQLMKEMRDLGVSDTRVDENAYVYGTIPASPGFEDSPCLGFIAHIDTAPDASGENVKPQILENYDGSDIVPFDLMNWRTPSAF